uniref:BTB domain-containing protein n=1 Tax=Meleagris gallopavo TaxID=9103 RepID=A0A803YSY2_MELGA
MPSERCLSVQEMLTGQRLCQSSSHNDAVLAALNQQRSDGILCDITLIAEEQKFHAHKAVLAACSDYFRRFYGKHPEGGLHCLLCVAIVSDSGKPNYWSRKCFIPIYSASLCSGEEIFYLRMLLDTIDSSYFFSVSISIFLHNLRRN